MTIKTIRKDNYPEWYQAVVAAADMAENSASPGCMVIKPWGYGIWERIRDEFAIQDHDVFLLIDTLPVGEEYLAWLDIAFGVVELVVHHST